MRSLLTEISGHPDCEVRPAAGQPSLGTGYVLPRDLEQFFRLCGGVRLFRTAKRPAHVGVPAELVPANPVILGEPRPADRSAAWHIVGRGDDDLQFFTIDLDPARAGQCYDSLRGRHAVVGGCPVIATSFTDFLARLWRNRGREWYWLRPGFEGLGDAYD